MKIDHILCALTFIICLASCRNSIREQSIKILDKWDGREFVFSSQALEKLHMQEHKNDSLYRNHELYTLVSYLDASVCTTCRINAWKEYINSLDMKTDGRLKFLLILAPDIKSEEISDISTETQFYCIDDGEEMLKRNEIPENDVFRTMLLDSNYKVLAIGNPLTNTKINRLFLKRITGKEEINIPLTSICGEKDINIGEILLGKPVIIETSLTNCGTNPLFITDVSSTCGCIKSKAKNKKAYSGEDISLEISVNPTKEGAINEKIFISCNDEHSPFIVKLKGFVRNEK